MYTTAAAPLQYLAVAVIDDTLGSYITGVVVVMEGEGISHPSDLVTLSLGSNVIVYTTPVWRATVVIESSYFR